MGDQDVKEEQNDMLNDDKMCISAWMRQQNAEMSDKGDGQTDAHATCLVLCFVMTFAAARNESVT
jgi:hypothetical protein